MRIYHVATLADWQQAKALGSYTTSTYGASLADVGFIHAARREQVSGVLGQFYQDVGEPVLVLEIETDLLDVPWREDQVGVETFPHIYGPLNTSAVVGYHAPSREGFERAVPAAPHVPVATSLTVAFQGVGCMLGLACMIFLVATIIESSHNAGRMYPNAAPALLLTFTIVSGACALVAFGFAAASRTRPGPASATRVGHAGV